MKKGNWFLALALCVIVALPFLVTANDGPEILMEPLVKSARDLGKTWSATRLHLSELASRRAELASIYERCIATQGSSQCALTKAALDGFDLENMQLVREKLNMLDDATNRALSSFATQIRTLKNRDAIRNRGSFEIAVGYFLKIRQLSRQVQARLQYAAFKQLALSLAGIDQIGFGLDDEGSMKLPDEQEIEKLLEEEGNTGDLLESYQY